MDLNAYTKTIGDLLSTNKRYVVPRFQRPYSWGTDQIKELWQDLLSCMQVSDGKIVNSEYFIGCLVLVGEDKSQEFKIVDGQQRLTTLTIIISALVQVFNQIGEGDLAQGLYTKYIEDRDDSNKPYFKLENETPRPFFQKRIQYFDHDLSLAPDTEEENSLLDAYTLLVAQLELEALEKEFRGFTDLAHLNDSQKRLALLSGIRDQCLRYLKVIYITVTDEQDAYTIFETLNARGINLSAVDLIKNDVFRKLKITHPNDDAKSQWRSIQNNLAKRQGKLGLDTFMRHFWISKYAYASEGKIYRNFKKLERAEEIEAKGLLEDLLRESNTYVRIAHPLETDWPQIDDKPIFRSLSAIMLFQVRQVYPFLLALLDAKDRKVVAHSDLLRCVKSLENFHFQFTAICSSRASFTDGKYSKTARDLRGCDSTLNSREVINGLLKFLGQRAPKKEAFIANFVKLNYTSDRTRNKKLIQYVFSSLERERIGTGELKLGNTSLEHIVGESEKKTETWVGNIGNLIPLDSGINGECGNKKFEAKMLIYTSSKLNLMKEFVAVNKDKREWLESDANARSKVLAEQCYDLSEVSGQEDS